MHLHFVFDNSLFLKHEDFQRQYMWTVIARIFYSTNRSRTGRITLKELRNSNLLHAFMHVDEETDINKVTEYFSYEHFYVLYCRFFELDTDKDSKLMPGDLLKCNEHALSEAIVERYCKAYLTDRDDFLLYRIFQLGARAGGMGSFQGGMTYSDFIYFMLSEEDKSNEMSLRYWYAVPMLLITFSFNATL